MRQDPPLLSAAALQQAYAQGLTDPVSLTRAQLAHTGQRNPQLHAFVHVSADLALQQAQGWVSNMPRGGSTVAKMKLQQLLNLRELLAELAAVAVRLSGEQIGAQDKQRLFVLHNQSRQGSLQLANGPSGGPVNRRHGAPP